MPAPERTEDAKETAVGVAEGQSTLVRFAQVHQSYGNVAALRDVSFTLRAGEVTALLGPNGAGKTTMMEILSGLRRRDGGEVSVLGYDPSTAQKKIAQYIGVQVQEFNLQATVRVGEALAFFASLYRRPVAPEELIQRFGLQAKTKARFDTLSGGQKRRLAIAKALVGDPQLVILDEPTSGLDPQGQQFLRAEALRLKGEGRGILLSTHDVGDAQRLADRVLIIHEGRIVADGTVPDVIQDLGSSWKVEFAGPVPEAVRQDPRARVPTSLEGTAFFDSEADARAATGDSAVRELRPTDLADAYFVATGVGVD